MRTTHSTDGRPTRRKAPRLHVAGVAVAVVAVVVAAGVIRAIPPSPVVGHEPVCGVTETHTSDASTAFGASGVGCDDDLRATYHLPQAWPQKWAGARVASGQASAKPTPDEAATLTAIALAESGGSTGT